MADSEKCGGNYTSERASLVRFLVKGTRDGLRDPRVIRAMRAVPRHRFVPESMQGHAYRDRALPIACGQTISQPLVVGMMTEWLDVGPESRILEIGTGSGYQTAVLAELAGVVHTIEYFPELTEAARETLESLDYRNIRYRSGDGYNGWPEEAPFDGIIVTCRVDSVPDPLAEQLKDGGRLVIPVGPESLQTLYAYKKENGRLHSLHEEPVRFVPMLRKFAKN